MHGDVVCESIGEGLVDISKNCFATSTVSILTILVFCVYLWAIMRIGYIVSIDKANMDPEEPLVIGLLVSKFVQNIYSKYGNTEIKCASECPIFPSKSFTEMLSSLLHLVIGRKTIKLM